MIEDAYTLQPADAGQYTVEAYGQVWARDMHTVTGGRIGPVAVDPAHVGRRLIRFTDDLGRECAQVEGTGGRAGRYIVCITGKDA